MSAGSGVLVRTGRGGAGAVSARRRIAVVVCLGLLAPCLASASEDQRAYAVTLTPTGDGAVDEVLHASSQLESLRDSAPVGAFGLVARARVDVDRLLTALESFGYYQANVSITIQGRPISDPELPEVLDALPAGESVAVSVGVRRGPLYHLRRITIDGDVPPEARGVVGLAPGMAARAAEVMAARDRLLQQLQEDGFAFARVDVPVAYEDSDAQALDVVFTAVAGERARLGDIRISGLRRVDEALVRRRLLVAAEDPYSPVALERARRDLLALGVFSSVTLKVGDAPDSAGRVPLTVVVQERPPHTLGFNATYSSDLGGSVGARWSDRDLFGRAEQLNITASAVELGGHATTGVGYNLGAQFIKPDYGTRDQTLQLGLTTLKQSLQAYDQTAQMANLLLLHRYGNTLTASAGLSGEREQVTQNGVIRDYTLVAAPLSLKYNGTGVVNPLDDVRDGTRATLSLTPTRALGALPSTFWVGQLDAAAFADLSARWWGTAGRTVLAVRALVGEVHGAAPFDLPPDQRFYAGGSTTVRGFRYQSVGPKFPAGSPAAGLPEGGSAIDSASIELRQRIAGNVGAVAFVDAGAVTADGRVFQGRPSVGTGVGLRYYTPIGPIRLDVAVPVTRLSGGDAFEIYVGLGQAF